ncbi:hypothetical protein B5807_09576 [Epicoccum nigrum]|uniref:Uncharacterized protein n=1 Tax=Epicoccum nigrum TaxID=105696 RepID=A0A1Y2LPA1_EPING|nr:hypothetical protein B5807_09576 [Epicoccum nigrum]
MEPEEVSRTTAVRYTTTPYMITPYKVTNGLPSEQLYEAEELRITIIELMHKEILDQQGVGLPHPYASGIFTVTHHEEGSKYIAQLNYYPSLVNGSHGSAAESKILRQGESNSEIVRAMIRLLWALDPSGTAYRNLSWIKGTREDDRSLRVGALS